MALRPLAVVRLIRLPGCLTASADSIAAALCVGAVLGRIAGFTDIVAAGVASFGIYAFGIVLGDVLDVDKDRRRHPGRPLTTGAVSTRGARRLAGVVLLLALGAAALAGVETLMLAILTVAAVLAHVLVLKRNDVTATIGMGACRVSNLFLGASVVGAWNDLPVLLAVATGLYVVALTGISAFEDRRGSRALFVALVVLLLTAILLPFPAFRERGFPIATAAPLFLILLRRAARARLTRTPETVGALVGRAVTGIVLLDAAYLFGFGLAPAAVAFVVLYLAIRMGLGPILST